MANDLNKKSLEQLQKEKLQSEIDILQAKLAQEYPEEDPPGFFNSLAEFARKWSAFILASVTLFSAIFGVFVPLSEYLDESRRALEFDLNENMIGFVNDLNADSSANRGIMMLSYYEMNSIPILLFYLEGSENYQKEFRLKIIETIDLIYAGSDGSEIVSMVMSRLNNNMMKLKRFDENGVAEVDPNNLKAIYNCIDLINGMKLTSSDAKTVNAGFNKMKDEICDDEFLREDLDVSGIFFAVCGYLNVEATCK